MEGEIRRPIARPGAGPVCFQKFVKTTVFDSRAPCSPVSHLSLTRDSRQPRPKWTWQEPGTLPPPVPTPQTNKTKLIILCCKGLQPVSSGWLSYPNRATTRHPRQALCGAEEAERVRDRCLDLRNTSDSERMRICGGVGDTSKDGHTNRNPTQGCEGGRDGR